jgi:hypothetical protein
MPLIAIYAIVAGVILSVGFGIGWGVKGWKDGAEVARAVSEKEKVEARNSILSDANDQCQTNIESVKKSVKGITDAVAAREKSAAEAMNSADALIARHKAVAAATKSLPPVPATPDVQCTAIVQEQQEYVKTRHQ